MITRLFAMICLVIVTVGELKGQTSAERSALNNLEKQRWDKAHTNLNKAIRKDSLSVTAHYITSLYFFTPDNPAYQIDSAYTFCMSALALYPTADIREREKLSRVPLDSTILTNLRVRIDSAAFGRAMQTNSEDSYIFFLESFPHALQRDRATELRDEVAYLDALKENTYQGFYHYLTKYPHAERTAEARKRYEKLLFTTLTSDKKLQSYEAFVHDYPLSPYREEALREVFEIRTASGDVNAFHEFLADYPTSKAAKSARDILFHMEPEHHVSENEMILTDSLEAVRKMNQGYLVPFLHDHQFGFMNSEGVDVIRAIGNVLQPDYLCGNIMADVLITQRGIIARNGSIIYKGEVDAAEELGYGFLLITEAGCSKLVHKSGWLVSTDCLEDARVLVGNILAIQAEGKWALWSLAGKPLTGNDFQQVKQIGKIIALQKDNRWFLKHPTSIGALANGIPLTLDDHYDAVEPWPSNRIWSKKDTREQILDEQFSPMLQVSNQKLSPTFFGAIGMDDQSQTLYNQALENAGRFKKSKIYDPWIGVQVEDQWRLFDIASANYISAPFDSISFVGTTAVGYLKDSMQLFFKKDFKRSFISGEVRFIPGKDSISFITVSQREEQYLFNSRGERLFTVAYDHIQYMGNDIFVVEKKKKKGLVLNDGKTLLPCEYDGVGGITNTSAIPILKSGKFGVFNIASRKLIKPTYDKNITSYGAHYLVAYKDGAYGFINWENKPQRTFEFEEVRYWNDSVAWVKKDFQWKLYQIETNVMKLEMVKSYTLIKDTSEEKIAIIHEDTAYGVISSKKGVIIPSTFSDIVNIGSAEKPFYMTEKYVEEASLFVVIYYDHTGKFLRRQAYEADDYERIYCTK